MKTIPLFTLILLNTLTILAQDEPVLILKGTILDAATGERGRLLGELQFDRGRLQCG